MSNSRRNEFQPDYASPPGETLQETLDVVGMTQSELAHRMGRTPKLVNEIVQGKATITPETAIQLERALGVPAHFWNRREQLYRDALARLDEEDRLESQVEWLDRFPVKDMVQSGWIPACKETVAQVRELLNFFGIASWEQWDAVLARGAVTAFRQSQAYNAQPEAMAAWLRRGELQAQQLSCAGYDKTRFKSVLNQIRDLTVELPADFDRQMVDLCASAGVALVFVPALPRTHVSGATRWLASDKALIQLSLRYKSDDQFWFSFFHEAGHIIKHGKRDAFVDSETTENSEQEQEANQFAADLLLAPQAYQRFVAETTPYFSKEAIIAFAQGQRIAPGVVVGRLQHDDHLKFSHCNGLKRKLEWG